VPTLRQHTRSREGGLTLIEVLVSMIVLAIISTMLVTGWINLQRASTTALSTNDARATGRDAMARVSSELRAAQPTVLPTPSASGTPVSQPVVTQASPYSVTFNSAYNSSSSNSDGSGVAAVRPTRIWLDTSTAQPAPWNPQCRTLYWQRDMNSNGSFTDSADQTIILARNIANEYVPDATNGTSYTPVFRYAYNDGSNIVWTDDANAVLSAIVGVRVRLIVDAKMGGAPKYIDTTTTISLRNASGV
jgi:prepilin-type N-terminal cleavage/methylation domain-containing protein